MARITKPLEGIPGFNFQGLQIDVPVDLPEGGHLCVIVGDDPLGVPQPSVKIPNGCMVAIIPANVAEQVRPALAQVIEHSRRIQNGGHPPGQGGLIRP